jgi:general secretion pathway protein K
MRIFPTEKTAPLRSRLGRGRRAGSALLAVLWLSAALSAIAFSVASTVRSETARASVTVEGLQAYYLAVGAADRAMLYMDWSRFRNPDGSPRYYGGGPHLELQFPGGQASVDIISESSKLNLNAATEDQLYALITSLGADPARAREIVFGITARRAAPSVPIPSFQPRRTSFEETEELLSVDGMTPELYYGTYTQDGEGRLIHRSGLRDCVTVFPAAGGFDVNTADPAVLVAIGVPPDVAASIVQARRNQPFTPAMWSQFRSDLNGVDRLGVGGGQILTIRATAWPRRPDGTPSDARRTVAAVVQVHGPFGLATPHRVLRWYDNPGVN